MREYMEKDIRQSLQEHIFRLENRRRELMRPEYLRLGLTIGQGQPRILMYLLTEDGCSQREIAENCHLDVTTLSRTLDRLAEKRASGAAHQSTVASGVPDLFDRGGKGDGSRGTAAAFAKRKKRCAAG